MNHKMIDRLCKKAQVEVWDTDDYNGSPCFVGYETDLDKFAELVVNECASRLRDEGELGKIQMVAGPSGTYKLAFMNEAANIIRGHFGVES